MTHFETDESFREIPKMSSDLNQWKKALRELLIFKIKENLNDNLDESSQSMESFASDPGPVSKHFFHITCSLIGQKIVLLEGT